MRIPMPLSQIPYCPTRTPNSLQALSNRLSSRLVTCLFQYCRNSTELLYGIAAKYVNIRNAETHINDILGKISQDSVLIFPCIKNVAAVENEVKITPIHNKKAGKSAIASKPMVNVNLVSHLVVCKQFV